ncbi:DUF5677 domain-containing protein [Corallococcus sp. AS-1-12]|uniref:DUF5677 domain-containing protein n=1 Tax=Corallococcus sp. AS-1-12 TaxID=2874598 RepID=UPI001CBBF24C|nr:DUF5677 domain-containing protein [Corallococcus sp. AS-1-12]MBZ4336646.1 DUF5677 domain-containing protein [Corallococcus sp. AS-1-12]
MKPHANWTEFATDVGPRFSSYLQSLKRGEIESWLHRTFWLFSFVHEGIGSKISKNKEAARILQPLLTEVHDILRGIVHSQEAVLLAATVLQARTAFEIHCTIKFIAGSREPMKYADRFRRYADVERFSYQTGSAKAPKLNDAQKEDIRKRCPEWFKADGSLRSRMNWTAEQDTDSIKKIAAAVGLLDPYLRGYAISSKITHGSPMGKNLYMGEGGMFFVANPLLCNSQAVIGAGDCLAAMVEFCEFAGVQMPQEEVLKHLVDGKSLGGLLNEEEF